MNTYLPKIDVTWSICCKRYSTYFSGRPNYVFPYKHYLTSVLSFQFENLVEAMRDIFNTQQYVSIQYI